MFGFDEICCVAFIINTTGEETLTFEYRNGRWVRIGSLFVAEKTEENVNGEWVPLQEEVERTVAAEEDAGFVTRTWRNIMDRF